MCNTRESTIERGAPSVTEVRWLGPNNREMLSDAESHATLEKNQVFRLCVKHTIKRSTSLSLTLTYVVVAMTIDETGGLVRAVT